mmetsp:Transcript_10831/g.32065  ORF Transcript_10831/g.32065 Transcript_10831/m.32065 type:complete len:163 (-) Transcript_10831:352-840(-)
MAGEPVTDFSCNEHADCAVKNVGNCCGFFPECVSASFCPDLPGVESWCSSNGISSICGWSNIHACVCENKKCEAVQCFDGNCDSPKNTYQASEVVPTWPDVQELTENISSLDRNCIGSVNATGGTGDAAGFRAADSRAIQLDSVPSVLLVLMSVAVFRFHHA